MVGGEDDNPPIELPKRPVLRDNNNSIISDVSVALAQPCHASFWSCSYLSVFGFLLYFLFFSSFFFQHVLTTKAPVPMLTDLSDNLYALADRTQISALLQNWLLSLTSKLSEFLQQRR